MIRQIKESSLYVNDLERTQLFYHDKLKFEIIQRIENKHVFFRAGNSILLCFLNGSINTNSILPEHSAIGSIHLAFEVKQEEYGNWKDKIKNLGIEIILEHDWGRNLKSFYFRDPDNHLLEIVPVGLWDYENLSK